MNKPIFLYGAPASGKTTLGKRLAAALSAEFIDLDHKIVEVAGCPIPQIFAEKGESYFRDLESKVLADVANTVPRCVPARGASKVISLGGGTLLRDANRAIAEAAGTVFCLDTPSDEELARRIGSEAGSRPLGNKARERAPHYNSFPNRVAASFDLDNSLVIVGKGLAPAILAGERVVADENVEKLYGGLGDVAGETHRDTEPADLIVPRCVLARGAVTATIPSGEEHKTIETVASLWKAFAAAGVGRKDRVVAVGGGVTGDLTGFAAATWMRGISWINVPTTLLSMVDASTGGKTGCDLPEGKNLAGAFHAPRLVVIDTDFLKTLPPEILRQGKAEMIKHAAIGGEACLEAPRPGAGGGTVSIPAPAEIAANLAVKVGVVREDPFETKGKRIFLNCGHTIGHAVEKLSNYTLAHGEAVAIGCVEEARLAVKMGLADEKWVAEFSACFAAAGLPTELPEGTTWEKMVPVMKGDKKRAGDIVTFTLPCGWGDVRAVPIDLGAGC